MLTYQATARQPLELTLETCVVRLRDMASGLWNRLRRLACTACPVAKTPNGYQEMLDGLLSASDMHLQRAYALYQSGNESDRENGRHHYHTGVMKLCEACALYSAFQRLGYDVRLGARMSGAGLTLHN